jgi:hypothetical protein
MVPCGLFAADYFTAVGRCGDASGRACSEGMTGAGVGVSGAAAIASAEISTEPMRPVVISRRTNRTRLVLRGMLSVIRTAVPM